MCISRRILMKSSEYNIQHFESFDIPIKRYNKKNVGSICSICHQTFSLLNGFSEVN